MTNFLKRFLLQIFHGESGRKVTVKYFLLDGLIGVPVVWCPTLKKKLNHAKEKLKSH